MREVNVQIVFDRTGERGTYRDAIYIPQEEYAALKDADVAKLEDQRYQAWVSAVEAPAVEEKPPVGSRELSKFAFRQLFSLDELLACDNYERASLSDEQKAAMRTMTLNFQVADSVNLDHPVTVAGVQALEEFGLLKTGRAGEILGAVPVDVQFKIK